MTSSSDGRHGPDEPRQEPLPQEQHEQQQQQQQQQQQALRQDEAAAPHGSTLDAKLQPEPEPDNRPKPQLGEPPTASPTASAPAPATQTAPTAAAPASSSHASADSAPHQPAAVKRTAPPSTPPPTKRVRGTDSAPDADPSVNGSKAAVGEPMPDAPDVAASNANEADQEQTQLQQRQQQQAAAAMNQFSPLAPFTPASMANLDRQHAYMMMALATMSGAPSAMSPPPTFTPAQVTLPYPMDDGLDGLGAADPSLHPPAADKNLKSFARIEFADSVFQMTTYAVIIGRDQRALQQARCDEKRAEEHRRRAQENASMGLPPPSPMRHDRSKFSKSYVSEEGGMLGPESDGDDNGRPAKRRKTSTTGSSQNDNDEAQDNIISNRQYVSHTPGAAAVDLTSLRPSPWHVPFIGIHSPGPNIASKTKAISREHLKIAYNQQDGVFEAIPLHKNGFFCEDVHYKSEKVVLRCGDRLQIKDVDFRFIINGVERGRTGAEEFLEEEASRQRHSHSGKEMSFDFEQSHGNAEIQDTSDELSDIDVSPPELSDFGEYGEGDEGEAPEAEEAAATEVEEVAKGQGRDAKGEPVPEPLPAMPQIPKKRGPGRPPKNGIMSKREQRLLKKQQQEMAKQALPQAPLVEPPVKRKVGRPRKHPLPEDGGERPEKRKYKPRKPKNEDGADGSDGSDAERRAREKKERKARPKSPPLDLKIEDYTEEQLQKPNKNYGVLIDETLTAAGPGGLTLKQIYKRICQRYPWFHFHTETKGWESSVRHNLIGNEAFKKDETTNLWCRVPGVELDAGKKRKAASPDRVVVPQQQQQGYGPYPAYPYGAPQHMPAPGAPGYPPGQVSPGYQVPGFPGHPGQPARPVQPCGVGSPTGQLNPPVAPQPPAPPHVPGGYGPPLAPARARFGVPQPGAYSSPYASRPPPPANPHVKIEDGAPAPPAAALAQHPPAAAVPGAAPVVLAPALAPVVPPVGAAANTVPDPAQASPSAPAPGARPSTTPPANAPLRPVIDPRLLAAVVSLKNGLVENLTKARTPKAEAIVLSALNRCIGLKSEATENEKMESICIKCIRQVIDGFAKNKAASPPAPALPSGASSPPPQPPVPSVFEAEVLNSLRGFKDVSFKALRARVGEARAEAVALSAIDRVLGLADASLVGPPAAAADADQAAGHLEGVEMHLIKSIRQLLVGMNQKLQDPK